VRRAQRGVDLRRDRVRFDSSLLGLPLSQPRPKPRPCRYWRRGRLHERRAVDLGYPAGDPWSGAGGRERKTPPGRAGNRRFPYRWTEGHQTGNGPTSNSGAISHARHGAQLSDHRLDLDRWHLPGPLALRALDLGAVVTRDIPEAITHRAIDHFVEHECCSWDRGSTHGSPGMPSHRRTPPSVHERLSPPFG
jgi:hypothetical protein